MKIDKFLFNLRREKNIAITVENGQLSVGGGRQWLDKELVNLIKSKKSEIVDYLESQKDIQQLSIPSSEVKERYALSSVQKRLYFEKALDKQSIAYNVLTTVKLIGTLDIRKFEETFQQIIRRHEVLRTSFEVVKGEIYQRVHSNVDFRLHVAKATEDIPSLVSNFVQPFNLAKAPLFRMGLFELAEEEYLLVLDIHHIITDGVSNNLLIKEFVALYNDVPLATPPLQYRDYAEWQQSLAYQEVVRQQAQFWSNEFAELPEELHVPLDYARSTTKEPRAESVSVFIDASSTQKLKKTAEQLGATSYAMLMSVYYILLSKLSGQEDVVVGTVTTGRFTDELAPVLGMFANTVPLRNFPKGELMYKEFLQGVQHHTASCFDHQMYQFDTLVNDLGVKREIGRNPLFDVFFVYQNYDQHALDIPGLSVEPVDGGLIKTIFDIELVAAETENEIALTFIYDASLFDKATIARYGTYFQNIITQITTDSNQRLSEIDMLPAEERYQLTYGFNNTASEYAKDKTIVDLFEEQVEKTPDHIAVRFQDTTLTYAELSKKSNQVAAYLQQEHAVKAGDRVGLLVEREAVLIPCIFGILKSGAVYVPLSPTHPSARVNSIIADADMKALVSRQQYIEALNIKLKSGLIDLNRSWNKINEQPKKKISKVGPKDLAYVIYTSGSTGTPKGVMIEHHSVVNRLEWMQKKYPLTETDVLLQKTPLVFDVSVWELFWWSFTGASLSILPPEEEKDPSKIMEVIARDKVTTLHFVPSMLSAFLAVAKKEDQGQLGSLRQVFASGEALKVDQVSRFDNILNHKYQTKLINLYGPTEATVDVSYYPCNFEETTIPIGRPIDNTQLYVVDQYGKLAPLGGIGELCIGGVNLARGYLNNPSLTDQKFVPNAFSGEGKIYKTGDLASWLPNGNICFFGRKDDQVKIRGYRIEPGEVANQLLQHDAVQEAVVTVRKRKDLVAFYVSERELDNEQLRSSLLQALPDYMVPQYYVWLDAMPLTGNGKLDRKALVDHTIERQAEYVAPRNAFEEQLSRVWADVLEVPRVGITDNYFTLGGDSIKAIKLIYQVNEQLQHNLKLIDLYTHNTIEALSGLAQSQGGFGGKEREQAEKEIEEFKESYSTHNKIQETYEGIYPMSGIEKGMLFYTLLKDENEQRFDNVIYHEQNYYEIPYRDFSEDIFKKALALMIQKHDTLRKVYDIHSFAHIILREINPEVHFIDISHLDKRQQEAYYVEKVNTERLKASGESGQLLWRMNVLKISPDFRYLIFDMHHSLMDGWSLHAFMTELNNTYFKLKEDSRYVPEKLACTYQDHIVAEIVEMNQPESIDFWREELKGYKRFQLWKHNEPHRFVDQRVSIDAETDHELQLLASTLNVSTKDLFFSAYTYVMGLLSPDNDFMVGLTTHNRPLVKDGDKLLGCFLNHVPVNVHIPPKGSWREYILSVVEKIIAIKAHERVPFYKIRQLTDEPLQDGVNPIFDVAFTYTDFWVTKSMFYPTENVSEESPNFWHDNNDVNQNTLFDIFVQRNFGRHQIAATYSTQMMSHEMVQRFLTYFTSVLKQFVNYLDQPICREEILGMSEKQCLLEHFNATAVAYSEEKTIIDRFDEQVSKRPKAIAAIVGDKSMTYEQFSTKVNTLTAYLVDQGVKGGVVGIMCDRSFELLIAMWAVMKAGGAYLPIDPSLPDQRKAYMLRDSGAKVVLTQTNVPTGVDTLTCVDLSQPTVWERDIRSVSNQATPDHLAYLIYTSGSTGQPKGVMIPHRAVHNFCQGISDIITFSDRRIISVTTASFDIFVLETLLPLQQGATVVLANENEQRDPVALSRAIVKHDVTMLQSTPSLMKVLMENDRSLEGLRRLTDIMVGGEAFPPSLLQQLQQNTQARIFNMYGPTETTVWSTVKELTDQPHITIGKPIANTQVYVIGERNELQPIGIAGELCISGDGLARGYHRRDELTVEKFVAHPFRPGKRFYRTGDLARWLPDGNLEHLGRMDQQVKIRGFRIELGEIENHLATFPKVNDAVVWICGEEMNKKLVGYYVSDTDVKTSAFYEYLSEHLPDYMIPTLYLRLDRLPLTPAGKVDRQALPAPELTVEADLVVPSNETEETLTAIWSEVLGIEQKNISVTQNFFNLGGHSLNVITLANKISKAFNVQMSLKDVFDRSSVQDQAALIEVINQMQSKWVDKVDLTEISV